MWSVYLSYPKLLTRVIDKIHQTVWFKNYPYLIQHEYFTDVPSCIYKCTTVTISGPTRDVLWHLPLYVVTTLFNDMDISQCTVKNCTFR
jgi:hypothetical protein